MFKRCVITDNCYTAATIQKRRLARVAENGHDVDENGAPAENVTARG